MTDINDFDSVFAFDPKYHFTRDKLAEVSHTQNILQGKTFFERLLNGVGIATKPRVYPPQNNHELRHLHEAIITSSASEDEKQALLYYLLKCVGAPNLGNELAEDFAADVFLSRRSVNLIEGIWQLDQLHYKEAIEVLSSPSMPQKFTEEILEVLLDLREGELAIALYQTLTPPFSNPKVLHKFFELLCQCSIADAYSFMRDQGDPTLFEILLEQALSNHGRGRTRNSIELVDLALTVEDEDKMYDFFLHGRGRNLEHAADVVVMRKIAMGKFTEVAANISSFNVAKRNHAGVTWDTVVSSIGRGTGPRSVLTSEAN